MVQGRLRGFPGRLPFGPMGGCSYRWRALSEPGELARPHLLHPPNPMKPNGASMVLATFAETKVARLPGRNPANFNGDFPPFISKELSWEAMGYPPLPKGMGARSTTAGMTEM